MNPLLSEGLASIIRWGLAILAGYLVQAGIWTEADAAGYVTAAALALTALAWSMYQKYAMRTKLVTALSTEATTEARVEDMISRGQAAPVSTLKTEQARQDR